MKIKLIFDSVEERNEYFSAHCPVEIGIPDTFDCYHGGGYSCQECWKLCGLEYEIKSDQKESIKMTAEQKQPTYTDAVYELIKDECKDLDAIYEDYIVSLVGNCGLGALKRAGLLEGCGVLNCRQLYTLVERIDIPEDQIIIDRDIKDEKGTYTGGVHETYKKI